MTWTKFKKRFRDACRTNEPQVTAVTVMTGANLLACWGRSEDGPCPWWLWLGSLLIWPTLAFMANLNSPIPPDVEEDK